MLIIIRNGTELSPKTKLVKSVFQNNFNEKTLCLIKNEKVQFREKWQHGQIQLPSSIVGLIAFYLLMNIKSPKDFRDNMIARLSHKKKKRVLTIDGFLSILTRTLYLHFGTSFRSSRLSELLEGLDTHKIFLVDEFTSLKCVDLNELKNLGTIIYVSQDIAHNRFSYGDNAVTRNLMFRLERDAISNFDLVIACSETEKLKYLEMGARKAISYPNIYPTLDYEPCKKEEIPSISIVLREHWGHTAQQSLENILIALSYLNQQIKVYMIGMSPTKVPKNVIMEHREFLLCKSDYLRVLGKSWIGINVGIHRAGTNERKYDYAEAGTVILSDTLGARGDILPHEYTYIDYHDLAAKIEQLLSLGIDRLSEIGTENRKSALSIAKLGRSKLLDNIKKIVTQTI